MECDSAGGITKDSTNASPQPAHLSQLGAINMPIYQRYVGNKRENETTKGLAIGEGTRAANKPPRMSNGLPLFPSPPAPFDGAKGLLFLRINKRAGTHRNELPSNLGEKCHTTHQ